MTIFPVPQKAELAWDEATAVNSSVVGFCGYNREAAERRFKAHGFKIFPGGAWVKIIRTDKENLGAVPETGEYCDEKYTLTVDFVCNNLNFVLRCCSDSGWFRGLNTVEKLLKKGRAVTGRIEDYPLFAVRGFIEGFYGREWTASQRLVMLETLAGFNINTYFYGPKNDDFCRRFWYSSYGEAQLEGLREITEHCRENRIDFVYCISPGLNIKYSSARDFSLLLDKILQVYALGVRRFALLLDDIPDRLQHPSDIEAYKNVCEAHIDFVLRCYGACKKHDSGIKLYVCPLLYCGTGKEEYISALGHALPGDISLFWTGRAICSPEITAAEARIFTENTGHAPLYWDNYPVNDANMYNEMHLGPLINRDRELYRCSDGLISNAMEYCESSKIALMTAADYLWNPNAYDPRKSWENALLTVVGEENLEDFKLFADNLLTSCLNADNSAVMARTVQETRFALITKSPAEAAETLAPYVKKLQKSCEMLNFSMKNRSLRSELDRWINKFNLCCSVFCDCLEYLKTGGEEMPALISRKMSIYKADPTVLADFCFEEFTDTVVSSSADGR